MGWGRGGEVMVEADHASYLVQQPAYGALGERNVPYKTGGAV